MITGDDVISIVAGVGADHQILFSADRAVIKASIHRKRRSSTTSETVMLQHPPEGDRRYRVHRSEKFYVGELVVGTAGATWYFQESAERVVYASHLGRLRVTYRSKTYPLRPASELRSLVLAHLALDGAVVLANRYLNQADEKADPSFDAYPFIDITSAGEHARFKDIIAARS